MEGVFRYIRLSDALADKHLILGDEKTSPEVIAASFQRAVQRGTLLEADAASVESKEQIYFLNSARGRAALQAFEQGAWHPDLSMDHAMLRPIEKPNIFQLYEENIGPLTPIIAEFS